MCLSEITRFGNSAVIPDQSIEYEQHRVRGSAANDRQIEYEAQSKGIQYATQSKGIQYEAQSEGTIDRSVEYEAQSKSTIDRQIKYEAEQIDGL